MADTLQKTPRERSIEKGKQIIIAITAYYVFLEVSIGIVRILTGQVVTVVSLFRIGLTTVLLVYLHKGQNWARLLLSLSISLSFFNSVYHIYVEMNTPTMPMSGFILLVILTILHGLTAYLLIFSIDIDEFLRNRRT